MAIRFTTALPVQLSYEHIFQANVAMPGAPAKYGAQLLIPKTDTATLEGIKAAVQAAIAEKFPNGKLPVGLKMPALKDGDAKNAENPEKMRPEIVGHWYIDVRSDNAPGVIDKNKQKIIDPGEIYSGCFVFANLSVFYYDKAMNKGFSIGLNHIMKVKDGPNLGGRGSAEDAFSGVKVDPSSSVNPADVLKPSNPWA